MFIFHYLRRNTKVGAVMSMSDGNGILIEAGVTINERTEWFEPIGLVKMDRSFYATIMWHLSTNPPHTAVMSQGLTSQPAA